jgi:hypothetical protein
MWRAGGIAITIVAVVVAGGVAAAGGGGGPAFELVVSGLDRPRGMAFGPDGALYVIEAGSGGDECVEVPEPPAFGDPTLCFGATGAVTRLVAGAATRVVTGLPSHRTAGQITGAQDIAVAADGTLVLTVGYAQHPRYRDQLSPIAARMGRMIAVGADGRETVVADLAAHELANDPDPAGNNHSNPFGLLAHEGGFAVTDSAGNDLLLVRPDGTVETLAVFPAQTVDAPATATRPPGTRVPMASVPTSVVRGPDGALYVGEFTGTPFLPGMARVWRVEPGRAPEVHATGFTAVIDLAFDERGRLLVLEAARGGLGAINPANPATQTGALWRLELDGARTLLASNGLLFPTSVLLGRDGMVNVTTNGLAAGQGQVVRFRPEP